MDDLKYLLKIGQKCHLEEFVAGSLYCSTAEMFWGIENNKKIKGQGDVLEAGSKIFALNMIAQKYGSGEIVEMCKNSSILVHYEPAKNIPVFCLFSVYDDDCIVDEQGNLCINLSQEQKKTIKDHFPKADSVAVITLPEQFLDDVQKSIGCFVKHGKVNYFHIENGLPTLDGDRAAVEMEYYKYLTQDTAPIVAEGKKIYSFNEKYVFRVLFCKDIYFRNEKEYRIVLPNETINNSKSYPIKLRERIEIFPLSSILKQDPFVVTKNKLINQD